MRSSGYLRSCLVIGLLASYGAMADPADPYEKANRKLFRLHEKVDGSLVRPAARGYREVVPDFLRDRVGRFFDNLDDVNVLVNDLLQFKFDGAASDAGRLLVNSTIGIGGLFDPATKMGLRKRDEDWGQTLAVWQLGPGPYVFIPLMGPSTARDAIGTALDSLANPLSLVTHVQTRNTLFALDKLHLRSELFSLESLVSGDPYLFYRDGYLQRREYMILDGEVQDDFEDDF